MKRRLARTIDVPEGWKAVFVSDELCEQYADWALVHPCEARMTVDGVTVDCETRYIARPVQPSDVLVLSSAHSLSEPEVRDIADRWKAVAHEHPMILLDKGMEITELSDDDLQHMGLQRIES